MSVTIILVDDHDGVRKALRDWLEAEFSEYRVIEGASGEEAVDLIQGESECLIVMDITLPGMSGIEATRQIKAVLPSAQVVILTIHEHDTYRADALAAGATAYVPKRTMQTELIPTLAALLAMIRDTDLPSI